MPNNKLSIYILPLWADVLVAHSRLRSKQCHKGRSLLLIFRRLFIMRGKIIVCTLPPIPAQTSVHVSAQFGAVRAWPILLKHQTRRKAKAPIAHAEHVHQLEA